MATDKPWLHEVKSPKPYKKKPAQIKPPVKGKGKKKKKK